jgi:SAM-dependent methyltransferase
VPSPTERFSSRANAYVEHRPSYPEGAIDWLAERCTYGPESVVADVGSGTGISSRLFLRRGNRVYGVEPNRAMREAAEHELGADPKFVSVHGTAEATTLPDGSVDFVVAAQAFHWFDGAVCRQEFRRILQQGGWVVVLFNERLPGVSPFMQGYERLLRAHSEEYCRVPHLDRVRPEVIDSFFAPSAVLATSLANRQVLDFGGLSGRVRSTSYLPEPEAPGYAPMMTDLAKLFDATAVDGKVALEYATRVYTGRLDEPL